MPSSMAMQQEPIDWRYLPHIWPIQGLCKRISPQNMANNMVLTYLHVLDPEDLPLNLWEIYGKSMGNLWEITEVSVKPDVYHAQIERKLL